MQSHQCCVQGDDLFPGLPAYTIFDERNTKLESIYEKIHCLLYVMFLCERGKRLLLLPPVKVFCSFLTPSLCLLKVNIFQRCFYLTTYYHHNSLSSRELYFLGPSSETESFGTQIDVPRSYSSKSENKRDSEIVTFGALSELCTIFGVCNIILGLLVVIF